MPELCAAEQVTDVRIICWADRRVQLKGAVGEGALEDANLQPPVLQLSSLRISVSCGQETQVRWFQVKCACSVWVQHLTLKLEFIQGSIVYPLQGGDLVAWRALLPVTSAASHSRARPRLVSLSSMQCHAVALPLQAQPGRCLWGGKSYLII